MKLPFLSRFASAESPITYSRAISATDKARFGAMLTGIVRELPELLAVSVVELRSGEVRATHHIGGKLNPGKAAGYYAEIIRQKQQAIRALNLTDEAIEDILITLNAQWHVLRLLPGGRHFVHLMVNTRDTNLAVARTVMQAHTAGTAA